MSANTVLFLIVHGTCLTPRTLVSSVISTEFEGKAPGINAFPHSSHVNSFEYTTNPLSKRYEQCIFFFRYFYKLLYRLRTHRTLIHNNHVHKIAVNAMQYTNIFSIFNLSRNRKYTNLISKSLTKSIVSLTKTMNGVAWSLWQSKNQNGGWLARNFQDSCQKCVLDLVEINSLKYYFIFLCDLKDRKTKTCWLSWQTIIN